MNKYLLIYIFLFTQFVTNAQTIGLMHHDNAVSDGYTLFSPLINNEVFLINNCGEKINQWTFTEIPGATCYLLENGNLLRAGKDHIEIRDWNNHIVWSYATTANGISQHHDIEPLPNGNILCLAIDNYSSAEMTAKGRNPANTNANFRSEKIIELQPTGLNTATIVWEWKFMDHIIQDFNPTILTYGVVADHPELLDINYIRGNNNDYIHTNSIDYNADLDQILISARHLNEIYIIDHSTTLLESQGHSGGNSNRGGDFLWRWGNPEVYGQGNLADKKLFLQHDAKWVENGYVDESKISVFNNGDSNSTQNYTSVCLLQPEISNGIYTKSNNKFNPATYDWSWQGSILGVAVHESKQSGTHSLPNGNIIIAETSIGRVSEITKSGTVLWSYKNPTGSIVDSNPVYFEQNYAVLINENVFFRAEKYPANYIGFTGQNMTSATGTIENENAISSLCANLDKPVYSIQNVFVLNPANNNTIQFSTTISAETVTIFDINGRQVYNQNEFNGDKIEVNLTPSIYFIQIKEGSFIKKLKLMVSQ